MRYALKNTVNYGYASGFLGIGTEINFFSVIEMNKVGSLSTFQSNT